MARGSAECLPFRSWDNVMSRNPKRIVVVEDEPEIEELIRFRLEREGYEVHTSGAGDHALRLIPRVMPDLIVLDLMLPDVDGLEVCRRLRADRTTRSIPIVMLTARSEESDIVVGLELGADDYLTKPFSPRILVARIRAVLRRREDRGSEPGAVLRQHDLVLHPGRHEVRRGDAILPLTPTEFRILQTLMARPGWVFRREQIADEIHDGDVAVTERSIDVHIVSLRKKLGASGDLIETVRGVGYRFRE